MHKRLLVLIALLALVSPGAWSQAIGTINTVAGGVPNNVSTLSVSLAFPTAIARDSNGNIYVAVEGAGYSGGMVYKIDSTGQLTTYAGNGGYGFYAGLTTNNNGDGRPATNAQLGLVDGLAVDGSNNLFISDSSNNVIRKVNGTTGAITTYAGGGIGCTGQTDNLGDGCAATSAILSLPGGIATDAAGDLYIADVSNNRIREVLVSTGVINTVAGGGPGCAAQTDTVGDNCAPLNAILNGPYAVFVDSHNNIFITDQYNARVREVFASTALIQTIAGTGTGGFNGDNIPATTAQINTPLGLFVDANGNVFFGDDGNRRVREILASNQNIVTVAGGGSGCAGQVDGYGDGCPAPSGVLLTVYGLLVDPSGNIFSVDLLGCTIREVSASTDIIQVFAGNGTPYFSGDGGPATNAQFYFPFEVAGDSAGNFYIADSGNARIREVTRSTGVIQTVAGGGTGCTQQTDTLGDGCPATQAILGLVSSVYVDPFGNIYISDYGNSRIRKVAASTGLMETVAGGGTGCTAQTDAVGDGCPATQGILLSAWGVYADLAGNVFIADYGDSRIREVFASTGLIQTIAGTGAQGYNGDNIPANTAQVTIPTGIYGDSNGNIFFSDAGNYRIREIIASSGQIVTVAGTGVPGYNGDNIAATTAQITFPYGLFLDAADNIFITDSANSRVREIVASTGSIQTVAGTGGFGFSGDGGPATIAQLGFPVGLGGDPFGNLYISDEYNNRIRQVFGTIPSTYLTITTLSPPPGTVGVPYSYQFMTTGGTRLVTGFVTSGSVPPGLTLNGTSGLLSGTPTTAGTFTFSGQATDSSVPVEIASATVTITIAPAAPTLASITVLPVTPTVSAGGILQFIAIGNYSDGTTQNLTSSALWNSSSVPIATISNASATAGQATGVTGGTTTISATSASVVGSTVLTVVATPATLYVGSVTNANCCLDAINTSTNAVVKSIPVTTINEPLGVTPDQSRIYVADSTNNLVDVVDTTTNTLVTTIPVGLGATGVAITPNGQFGYVAEFNDSNVSVFNVATNTLTATIPVGFPTGGVTVTPDGSLAYATSIVDGTVAVINTSTNSVVTTLTLTPLSGQGAAGCLIGPKFNATGTLGYFLQSCQTSGAGSLTVLSIPSNTVVATVAVGTFPYDSAITPDGTRLYVVNTNDNTVSVVNTASNTVTSTLTVGTAPQSVIVSLDGTTAYVASTSSNEIELIQTTTDTVASRISLASPFGFALASPPAPSAATTLTLTPPNLVFGSIVAGTSSPPQSILVTNPGTAPVTLTGVGLTGPNASVYALVDGCPVPPATLAGGANCTLQATFNPATPGLWATSLVTITSTNGLAGSTQSAPLTGFGTGPTIVTFSGLTSTQAITAGTASVTLAGTIGNGTSFPAAGERVRAIINNVNGYSINVPAVIGANGAFSVNVPTSTIPASATPYPITYFFRGDATFTAATDSSTTLTVGSATLVSITVTPANPSLTVGGTQQFTATGHFSDGTTQNLTTTATWSSSVPTVATISSTGLATIVGPGTSTISASFGGVTSVTLNSGSAVTYLDSGFSTSDFSSAFTAANFTSAQLGPAASVLISTPVYISSLIDGSGAVWIGTNSNAGTGVGDTALYAISFNVPSAVSTASLNLYYAVDNVLGLSNPGIYINGAALPNSTALLCSLCATSFNQENLYTDANIAPLLVAGTNWLYFDAVNQGGPGGLIFSAKLTLSSGGASVAGSTLLTATPATTFPLTVTDIGTGNGAVTDNLGLINCVTTAGVQSGTCAASYASGTAVTLTATPVSPSAFAAWGGACAGTGSCVVTMTSAQAVTASFTPPPQQINVTFSPGTNATGMATYDCPSNPSPSPANPCLDPNAHALALTVPQVLQPFTVTVQATELPPSIANGICPNGGTPTTDPDCRFTSFFTYQTQTNGDKVVPLCYPYANGNCVHYQVFSGTPGVEPNPSFYVGPVDWYIGWNNDTFVPPAPYTGSTPRLYDDPDYAVSPTSPYGTDCTTAMLVGNPPVATNPPIYCQLEFDITTSYNPTKKVDAGVTGRTKQFNDVIVAFPPANVGNLTMTEAPLGAAVVAGSPIGFTITVSNSAGGAVVGATLTDVLPSGTNVSWTISPAYAGPGTCTISGVIGSQVLSCALGTINATQTFTIGLLSPSSTIGTYTDATTLVNGTQQSLAIGTLTVQGLAVAFSGLTPSQSIPAGTASINLSGVIGSGATFVPTGETVTITINGIVATTTTGANGTFSSAFSTANIPASTTPYPITYSYTGDGIFTAAADSSTALTVNAVVQTATLTVTDIGTGHGAVTDNLGQINCVTTAGAQSGTCSASYAVGTQVTLTATATAPSTFAAWGGACSGTSTCAITMTSSAAVSASFTPPPQQITLTLNPGTASTAMATYNCPSNPSPSPSNPCTDPNAHAAAFTIGQVLQPFAVTVQATELPPSIANGICPNGGTPTTDPDCRFTSFFTYQTLTDGDKVVPLCYPYANGNCVHYQVFSGTPGVEPNPSFYVGPVDWYVSWNNDAFVPPAPYTGSTPRLYDDPDYAVSPTSPYGTDCTTPMLVGNPPVATNPPIYCQFEFDITTSYNPTKKVDAGVTGRTKQFNDVVIAFPPASVGNLTVTETAVATPVTPGSPIGFTITITNSAGGPVTGATLTDALPSRTNVNWTISPAYTGPGTCVISGAVGSQVLNCTFGTISASQAFTIGLESANSSIGTYTDTATITVGTQQILSIGTLSVQGTSAFTGLTPSQSIAAGTASVSLSGAIASGTAYPATGEVVSISINGVTQTATIGANGAFSATFATASIPSSATPYVITYSYAGDLALTSASNTSTALTVAPANASTLVISPTSVDFGQVPIGGLSIKSITLTNVGATAIKISSVAMSHKGTGNFRDYSVVNRCPRSLAAGKSCVVVVSYSREYELPFPATSSTAVVITDTAADSPQSIPLKAQNINPKPKLSSSLLTFGAQKVGTTSNPRSVTLTNVGTTPLTINSISIRGDFALDASSSCQVGASLAPHQSCTLVVTFTPTTTGLRPGLLSITDNAVLKAPFVVLSGTGQ